MSRSDGNTGRSTFTFKDRFYVDFTKYMQGAYILILSVSFFLKYEDLKETLYTLNLSFLTFLCIISFVKMTSPALNLPTRRESGTEVDLAAGG
jgi:hypothetical protein